MVLSVKELSNRPNQPVICFSFFASFLLFFVCGPFRLSFVWGGDGRPVQWGTEGGQRGGAAAGLDGHGLAARVEEQRGRGGFHFQGLEKKKTKEKVRP